MKLEQVKVDSEMEILDLDRNINKASIYNSTMEKGESIRQIYKAERNVFSVCCCYSHVTNGKTSSLLCHGKESGLKT